MTWDIVLFLIGGLLAAFTLRDVFDTVVVPGGSRASLRVAHRLTAVLLPLWKTVRGRRRGVSGTFAPVVLVGCFIIWFALIDVGFGLMAYAARSRFEPALPSLAEGIYMIGSSMLTLGPGREENAIGFARWIIVGAGFCGLAVMTMAVTYLLQVQSSIARRDTGIFKLNTSAGNPPSAVALLERFAAIDDRKALRDILEEGRDWCVTVRQSHSSHPSLLYFQSVGTGAGWPAALGALLDLALLFELCSTDHDVFGPAVLLGEDGTRMARELAMIVSLKPKDRVPDEEPLRQAVPHLAQLGYPMRDSPDYAAMARRRAEYQSCVDALAAHLGKPTTTLMPPRASADAGTNH